MSKKNDLLKTLTNKETSRDQSGAAMGAAAAPFLGGEQKGDTSKVDTIAGQLGEDHDITKYAREQFGGGSTVSTNVRNNENTNVQSTMYRNRYGFDLRPVIHTELKILATKEHKKLYELAEEAFIKLLEERGVDIRGRLKED